MLALSLTLVACNNKPAPAGSSSKPAAETSQGSAPMQKAPAKTKVSLADWEGTWNGFHGYLDNPELDSTYEEVAGRDSKKADEVKAEIKKKVAADFTGITIKGDKISFLDGFEKDGGKELSSATYSFVESRKVTHGGAELEWDIFKANEADAPYPYMVLMPVHGEEELVHFHLRYGNSIDDIMARDDWYPTFVAPSSTMGQIKEEIKE
ncbi:ZinT/AdcA family metal-binding protein [Collinsella sp. zg1085]|nr:ZinT/AdcA family metal-binding protein [Collinsella sp. zg1085]